LPIRVTSVPLNGAFALPSANWRVGKGAADVVRRHAKKLARACAHVANQRRDFHHKTARALVQQHGLIGVEDLNIKGLAGSMLAKSIHDAGWSQFLSILTDKAAEAGRTLIRVNPAGTTQRCSACGEHVPKTLNDRWHRCGCGLSVSRDLNAALNVLHLATGLGWSPQAPTVEGTRAVA
jgi:putative transposase